MRGKTTIEAGAKRQAVPFWVAKLLRCCPQKRILVWQQEACRWIWFGVMVLPLAMLGQTAEEPEFSAQLKNAAPEFEWISGDAIRNEVVELVSKDRRKLGDWAIRISEIHGLSAGLSAANLPSSLRYLPAALGVSGYLLGEEDHRKGEWMMHSSVAAKYGLLMNLYIDERFDPELSVEAAIHHLSDLWQEFKPSSLAVLAFLSSPANVRQAQYRSCDAMSCRSVLQGIDAATLQLYHRFLAVLYVYTYHKDLIPSQARTPANKIPHVRFERAEPVGAYLAWMKEDSLAFRKQNPHLLAEVIPLGGRVYFKRELPKKAIETDNLQAFGFQRLYAKPDSLAAALRSMKADPELWMELNGIDPGFNQAEESMLLPLIAATAVVAAPPEEIPIAPITREPQKPNPAPKSKIRFYTVRSGDTLWSIAQKYPGVSHIDIQKANRMGNKDRIQPGQKLKIPQ